MNENRSIAIHPQCSLFGMPQECLAYFLCMLEKGLKWNKEKTWNMSQAQEKTEQWEKLIPLQSEIPYCSISLRYRFDFFKHSFLKSVLKVTFICQWRSISCGTLSSSLTGIIWYVITSFVNVIQVHFFVRQIFILPHPFEISVYFTLS